jgi:hypothetical protein
MVSSSSDILARLPIMTMRKVGRRAAELAVDAQPARLAASLVSLECWIATASRKKDFDEAFNKRANSTPGRGSLTPGNLDYLLRGLIKRSFYRLSPLPL